MDLLAGGLGVLAQQTLLSPGETGERVAGQQWQLENEEGFGETETKGTTVKCELIRCGRRVSGLKAAEILLVSAAPVAFPFAARQRSQSHAGQPTTGECSQQEEWEDTHAQSILPPYRHHQ